MTEGAPNAETAKLFEEREKRINDAIALRKPDRVPVWHGVPGPYPAERLGISREEQMMDPRAIARGQLPDRPLLRFGHGGADAGTRLHARAPRLPAPALGRAWTPRRLRLAVRRRGGHEARGIRRAHLRPLRLHHAQVLAPRLREAGRPGRSSSRARSSGLFWSALRLLSVRHSRRSGSPPGAERSGRGGP